MADVEIVVPVALFLAIVLILVAFFIARYLTRKQVHGTIRQAIDKGQELTPEILERLGETPKSPESDLRRGLMAVGIALAFGMFSFAIGEDRARGGHCWGSLHFRYSSAWLTLDCGNLCRSVAGRREPHGNQVIPSGGCS